MWDTTLKGLNGCWCTPSSSPPGSVVRDAVFRRLAPAPVQDWESLGLFVNVAPMADIVEEDAPGTGIEFVEDPVVSDPQPILWTPGQTIMWIGGKPRAHVVHLPLDGLLDCRRQPVKSLAERARPNLKRGIQVMSARAGTILSGRDVSTGLVELGLDLFA